MIHRPVVPFTEPPPMPVTDLMGWLVIPACLLTALCAIGFAVVTVPALFQASRRALRRVFIAAGVMLASSLPLAGAVTLRDHLNDTRREAYGEEFRARSDAAEAALNAYYDVQISGWILLPEDPEDVSDIKLEDDDGEIEYCLLHVLPDPDVGQRLAISCSGDDLTTSTEVEPAP